jgi:hypothetical protein
VLIDWSFAVGKRSGGARALGRHAIEEGVVLYRDAPWSEMKRIEITLPDVNHWLLEWRAWLSKTVGDPAIDDTDPEIYVSKKFRPATSLSNAPSLPLAYAVFGSVGVPIAVEPYDRRTRASIRLDDVEVFPAKRFLED